MFVFKTRTGVYEGEGAHAVPEGVQLDGGGDGLLPHGQVVEQVQRSHLQSDVTIAIR